MELKATTRTVLGKKVKNLRSEGVLPAEMFGHDVPNLHLSVIEKEFVKLYRAAGENTIIDLVTDDGKKNPALILNVSRDPLTQKILSIDLYRVRMDEKIKTKVPITFTGDAPATKDGFIVVKVTNEIEIEALPKNIPNRFTVSLAKLTSLGQAVHVSDLEAPKDVRILSNPTTVVVTINERAKEEVVTPPPTSTTAETPAAGTETATAEPQAEVKSAPQGKKEK